MKPTDLILRCYINKKGDQWQAFCIDFCLAAQGESLPEVKNKLKSMISEYLYDALVGEDREFANQLLKRKAPFKQIATYHYYAFMHHIGLFRDGMRTMFKLPMPLVPQANTDE